ncbi:MAG TPA: hypothetical protein VE908_10115 [Mycobacterium sp.]|nr:hypothetical protein [Mycobacterium sp.]
MVNQATGGKRAPQNRLERRKQRTREALMKAAQTFIAAGKLNVPLLDITQAADDVSRADRPEIPFGHKTQEKLACAQVLGEVMLFPP